MGSNPTLSARIVSSCPGRSISPDLWFRCQGRASSARVSPPNSVRGKTGGCRAGASSVTRRCDFHHGRRHARGLLFLGETADVCAGHLPVERPRAANRSLGDRRSTEGRQREASTGSLSGFRNDLFGPRALHDGTHAQYGAPSWRSMLLISHHQEPPAEGSLPAPRVSGSTDW